MRRRASLAIAIALGGTCALLGCASPTLPLPPPSLPTATIADADHVKLTAACGSAEADAVLVIINTNPQVPPDQAVGGTIASACGAWDATVYAHAGDYLQVTQEIGNTRSIPLDLQAP